MPCRAIASPVGVLCLLVLSGCSAPSEEPDLAAGVVAAAPPRALTFPLARTPERLKRGEYLVEAVAHCFHCHSDVDWTTGQPKQGKKGGGAVFDEPFGWLVAPNISPDVETGAGSWTDEQFVRAVRNGIAHDDRVLFPMMPYYRFREVPDEDLASIVVYVRSIAPVRNRLPKSVVPQQFAHLVKEPPPHVDLVPDRDLSTPEKRGAYLETLADCGGCHTPFDDATFKEVDGFRFGGGGFFAGGFGEASARNITPDASGISYFDENTFIQAMRTGKVGGVRPLKTIMPWSYIGKMTDDDLKSLHAFLKSLPPIKHHVDNTEPVAKCARCGLVHHGGAGNAP